MTAASFYVLPADGVLACQLCHGRDGRHAPQCAVVAVRMDLQEVGGDLGLFVATMRELLDGEVDVQEMGAQLGLYVATVRERLDHVDGLLRGTDLVERAP